MVKIIIVGVFLMFCSVGESSAQSGGTKIARFEIDGKTVSKSYKVLFLHNGNFIKSKRTDTGFIVPHELKGEEYLSVIIVIGKDKLEFTKVHISKFDTKWVVGIDRKPYLPENVDSSEAETVSRVYYINFEGGGLETRLLIIQRKL